MQLGEKNSYVLSVEAGPAPGQTAGVIIHLPLSCLSLWAVVWPSCFGHPLSPHKAKLSHAGSTVRARINRISASGWVCFAFFFAYVNVGVCW